MSTDLSWFPRRVFIAGAGGKEDVISDEKDIRTDDIIQIEHKNIRFDLMKIFSLQIFGPTRPPTINCRSLYFSPKIYPPTREGSNKISGDIITAFLDNGNTKLICHRSQTKTTVQIGMVNYDTLHCAKGEKN